MLKNEIKDLKSPPKQDKKLILKTHEIVKEISESNSELSFEYLKD